MGVRFCFIYEKFYWASITVLTLNASDVGVNGF
jgi:hypothetical protein